MKKVMLNIVLACGCASVITSTIYPRVPQKKEISEQELKELFQYFVHTVQRGADPIVKVGLPVVAAHAERGHITSEDLLTAYGAYAAYEGLKKLFEEKTGHALALPIFKEDSFKEGTKTRRLVALSNYGIYLTNKTLDALGPIFVQALLQQGLKTITHEK